MMERMRIGLPLWIVPLVYANALGKNRNQGYPRAAISS
jgi:hypothetical protein